MKRHLILLVAISILPLFSASVSASGTSIAASTNEANQYYLLNFEAVHMSQSWWDKVVDFFTFWETSAIEKNRREATSTVSDPIITILKSIQEEAAPIVVGVGDNPEAGYHYKAQYVTGDSYNQDHFLYQARPFGGDVEVASKRIYGEIETSHNVLHASMYFDTNFVLDLYERGEFDFDIDEQEIYNEFQKTLEQAFEEMARTVYLTKDGAELVLLEVIEIDHRDKTSQQICRYIDSEGNPLRNANGSVVTILLSPDQIPEGYELEGCKTELVGKRFEFVYGVPKKGSYTPPATSVTTPVKDDITPNPNDSGSPPDINHPDPADPVAAMPRNNNSLTPAQSPTNTNTPRVINPLPEELPTTPITSANPELMLICPANPIRAGSRAVGISGVIKNTGTATGDFTISVDLPSRPVEVNSISYPNSIQNITPNNQDSFAVVFDLNDIELSARERRNAKEDTEIRREFTAIVYVSTVNHNESITISQSCNIVINKIYSPKDPETDPDPNDPNPGPDPDPTSPGPDPDPVEEEEKLFGIRRIIG